jgi:ElaB/YqjD/DUF883 family membrane-anchored ribosome-binding protein
MGEDPAAIRQEIEATRERMGDAVDALGYKADVPARTKESLNEKVEGVRAKISGARSQVSAATPDAGDVKRAGRQAAGIVQENPLGLAIGAAAVGFLAGMLAPSTRVEDERLGPVADEVKQQARQTGQEALERGKTVAQQTAQTAADSARHAASEVADSAQQTAQRQAEDLKTSAHQSAQQVKDTASSA